MAVPPKRRSSYDYHQTAERLAWLRDNLWSGSQIQMARETGVYQGSLSNILRGKREAGRELLHKIGKHPRINESWLLTGQGEPIVESELIPVAGEAALHVARQPFTGLPHDNPECLEHYLLPVHRSLYKPTRYWIRVDEGHPLTEHDSACIRAGDHILFEADSCGWPTSLAGHPCIVLTNRGRDAILGFDFVPQKATTDIEPPAKSTQPRPGEREQRVIMLDAIDSSKPEPRSSLAPRKKRTSTIIAVGIYREGAF